MAGGLGSRFWPVSGVDCPKQFIDAIGVGRSLLQLTFERFERLCPREHIIVVTGEQYVERVHEQVPGLQPWQVLGEPLRRNTAPCIAYAASVVAHLDPEATLIVSPSDHAIFRRERFVADMRQAVDAVQDNDWIITLGAVPVKPDTSYGYIQYSKGVRGSEKRVRRSERTNVQDGATAAPDAHPLPEKLFKVVTFTEKPPVEMARQFIASGEFFWNAGILVWRLPVLQEAYLRYLPSIAEGFFTLNADTPREVLEEVYSQCESISIDHGIMEKAENVHVLEASFSWSDVETWDSLYEVFRHDANGNTVLGGNVFTYDSHNNLVVMPNDPDKTVVIEGLEGYIVAASKDTLMICRRQSEDMIFRFSSDVELKKLIDGK